MAFIPGTHFKDGKLYLFSADEIQVLSSWPDIRAWKWNSTLNRWVSFRPIINENDGKITSKLIAEYEFLTEENNIAHSGVFEKAVSAFRKNCLEKRVKRAEAFRQFFSSIPKDVKRVVRAYQNRRFHVLSTLARVPGALDLGESNPALLYAVSCNWKFKHPPVKKPMRSARSLVRKKQRKILEWLGFPENESTVRLFRKIVPVSLTAPRLIFLRNALQNAEQRELLQHLIRINASVLRLVTDPLLYPYISPRFLQEISVMKNNDTVPRVAFDLIDVIGIARQAEVNISNYRFNSINRLEEVRQELRIELNMREFSGYSRFKLKPPIPGTDDGTAKIVPLNNAQAIVVESLTMHHCIANYIAPIISGKVFAYKITRPVRATFVLRNKNGKWTLGENDCRGALNKVVPEAIPVIKQWLQSSINNEKQAEKANNVDQLLLFE
ncbi:PcfJ domain-containing protein [candidate division KSB1 bacterium]